MQLLVAVINQCPESFPRISGSYYALLSHLVSDSRQLVGDRSLLLTAIRVPLIEHIELHNNGKLSLNIVFYILA